MCHDARTSCVAKSSQRRHNVVTTWSRRGHEVVTRSSRGGHNVATTSSQRRHNVVTSFRNIHCSFTSYALPCCRAPNVRVEAQLVARLQPESPGKLHWQPATLLEDRSKRHTKDASTRKRHTTRIRKAALEKRALPCACLSKQCANKRSQLKQNERAHTRRGVERMPPQKATRFQAPPYLRHGAPQHVGDAGNNSRGSVAHRMA